MSLIRSLNIASVTALKTLGDDWSPNIALHRHKFDHPIAWQGSGGPVVMQG